MDFSYFRAEGYRPDPRLNRIAAGSVDWNTDPAAVDAVLRLGWIPRFFQEAIHRALIAHATPQQIAAALDKRDLYYTLRLEEEGPKATTMHFDLFTFAQI